MESSSSSDNGSSLGDFVTEVKEINELIGEEDDSLFTFKSRVTISLPPDATSHQMSRSASAPQIDRGADELSAFLRVDGADGTHYHQQAIYEEAGNASLGCLERPTPNDELAEYDKRSDVAATTRTLGRSVNIHNSSLLCAPLFLLRDAKIKE